MNSIEKIEKIKHRMGMRATVHERELDFFLRTQKIARSFYRMFPGIGLEGIYLVNSSALLCTHPESDIDLLVITRPGHLMVVRVFLTMYLKMRGELRRGDDEIGKFCLSFFIDTDHLDMSRIALEGGDPYLELWTTYAVAAYTQESLPNRWKLCNSWTKLPFAQVFPPGGVFGQERNILFLLLQIGYRGLDFILYNFYQLIRKHIRLNRAPIETPWGVVIERGIQKLHPNDRRMEWKSDD